VKDWFFFDEDQEKSATKSLGLQATTLSLVEENNHPQSGVETELQR